MLSVVSVSFWCRLLKTVKKIMNFRCRIGVVEESYRCRFLLMTKIIINKGVVRCRNGVVVGVVFFFNYEKIMISLLRLVSFVLIINFFIFLSLKRSKKNDMVVEISRVILFLR